MAKQRQELKKSKKIAHQERHKQEVDGIVELYVNAKNGHLGEPTELEQEYIERIAKYWLCHHGNKVIRLNGKNEHYGAFAILGALLGLILMLVILYYLPV